MSNSIALIAVAALFGIEAWKANGGIPRLVLTLLAIAFALSGLLLNLLAKAVPKVGEIVSDIFTQPASWFILAVALFFVIRPIWSSEKKQPVGWSRSSDMYDLYERAHVWVSRVRSDREMNYYQAERWGYENHADLARDGISLVLTFRNAEIAAPNFETTSAENICVGLEHYFSQLMPFMRDGHVAQVDAMAEQTATRAAKVGEAFKPENWFNG